MRARRLLAVAAGVAVLVAFTTLARPQESSSARLRIGEPDGARPGQESEAGDEPARSVPFTSGYARPLDPATLADVPSHLLEVGVDQFHQASPDGDLLAVPDLLEGGGGEVRVVDAQSLLPVTTVSLGSDGLVAGSLGFTAEADAIVVQRAGYPPILVRHPLDAEQPSTSVALPEGTERAPLPDAALPGGRMAMVVVERPRQGPTLARVVVADLLVERLVVDLPLPDLQIDVFRSGEAGSSSQPGIAWDTTRERLYVAHADRSRVTVVDLATATVAAEADVGTPVPDAGAEMVQRRRWAEISPDGTRLYTSGGAHLPASEIDQPFGLSVIDTATLTEVGRIEGVSSPARLSPDGRWLLWTPESGNAAIVGTEIFGLVTLFGGGEGPAYPLGFSRDSAYVYLEDESGPGPLVTAYALPSLERTGERSIPREAWFDPASGLLREGL